MSKPKEQAQPVIESLKVSDLTVEPGFNVRSEKQFKANVKELSALVGANGFIDASIHVVQYVERGGKKLIRGGHTLHAAAQELGMLVVPAIKVEFDSVQEQLNLVTSNTGHPLSPFEQGTVYIRLRDGESAEGKEPGDTVREPMTAKAIALAVGLTERRVLDCMAIREASPEIGELIEAGAVSANVVTRINQLDKSDTKRLQIIKAAINHAKDEGRDCATKQDLDAIKGQYVTPKKLKAAKTGDSAPTNAAPSIPASEPEDHSEASGGVEQPDDRHEERGESQSSNESPGDKGELNLEPASAKKVEKAHSKDWREKMISILNDWGDECTVTFGDGDLDNLLDKIEAANLPF